MNFSLEELHKLMESSEDEQLEFKEAKKSFHFELLAKYCSALANEGGGHLILGITNKRPRKSVGSEAFPELGDTKNKLYKELNFRIDATELMDQNKRIVAFRIPSRHRGMAVSYRGAYWTRIGEGLEKMKPEQLKKIFEEDAPDYSALICPAASFSDLDSTAIQLFRERWILKSKNQALRTVSDKQLLSDAELIMGEGVTHAALILFGTNKGLGRHLPQAEIIFEYRSSEASLPAHQRKNYRQGLFLFLQDIENTINLRNDVQQFRDGFFTRDISTFNIEVVREGILNAISHRDYRHPGSVFIRQYPRKMEIVSPGGFPPGITEANVLWKHIPRNRRIAEALEKCNLVERSGQGMNLMFEGSIREGKSRPDFTGTDDYQVSVTLYGEVQDPRFIQFLEKIGMETLATFTTEDFLLLDSINREQSIPTSLKSHLPGLVNKGIIERQGHGRGVKYLLSRRFYKFLGEKGTYTRKRGLDRETNKELLLKHIRDNRKAGCQLQELVQVLPSLSHSQVQKLLQELKKEGRIYNMGHTSAARWYAP